MKTLAKIDGKDFKNKENSGPALLDQSDPK